LSSTPREPKSVQMPWRTLLLSAVLPFVVYQGLTRQGFPVVQALAGAMVFPAIDTVFSWVTTRKPDMIAIGSLAFLAISVLVSLLTDEPLVVLLRPSVTTGIFGIVCFVSLRIRRPLIFYFARQVMAIQDAERAARFDDMWREDPRFRRAMRVMTIAWGCWFLASAGLRTVAVFNFDIGTFLGIWPIVSNVGHFAMIGWSLSYASRAIPEQPEEDDVPTDRAG
jgi:intracellular septation protein A